MSRSQHRQSHQSRVEAPENQNWFPRWHLLVLSPWPHGSACGRRVSSKDLPGRQNLAENSAAFSPSAFTWIFKFVPNRTVHWKPRHFRGSDRTHLGLLKRGAYDLHTIVKYDKITEALDHPDLLTLDLPGLGNPC